MENKNLELLDKILLSENVCSDFRQEYLENQKFRNWLYSVMPSVEACRKQRQSNPWHIYGVLDHILHSVENINKSSQNLSYKDRRLLAYTMFLHDSGKPYCVSQREKDGYIIDSFFNHNLKSAEIAKKVTKKFGFDKEDCKRIENLVLKHDIFMFIRVGEIPEEHKNHWRSLSQDLIKQEINDLNQFGDGNKLFGYLIKVGYADNRAQNPRLANTSIKLLDSVQKMYDQMNAEKEL